MIDESLYKHRVQYYQQRLDTSIANGSDIDTQYWKRRIQELATGQDQQSTDPLKGQIGGSHYTEMGIQPLESVLLNFGYQGLRAAVYTKVMKYLARQKGDFTQHIEDLEKAKHVLDIQIKAAHEEQAKKPMFDSGGHIEKQTMEQSDDKSDQFS